LVIVVHCNGGMVMEVFVESANHSTSLGITVRHTRS